MSEAPHDLEAEESLLGAMLNSRQAIASALSHVTPADFYRPGHAAIFTAIAALYDDKHPADSTTVADELRRVGVPVEVADTATLIALANNTPSTLSAERYAQIIERHADARAAMGIGVELSKDAATGDPYEAVELANERLSNLTRRHGGRPAGLTTLDEILDMPDDAQPFGIPRMLRRDEVLHFVGTEGSGKSTLIRQWATRVGQGVDVLDPTQMVEPLQVLIGDAENSLSVIQETGRWMRQAAQKSLFVKYDPKRVEVFRRQQGMELRTRRGLREFEDAIEAVRPAVVFAGPLYQLAEKDPRERDDDYANAMKAIFNRLRVRYNFALVIEDHAPGEDGGKRPMRPFGSSIWRRWADFGVGLNARDKDGALVVSFFRGNRSQRPWPSEFLRGKEWPWDVRMPDGFFRHPSDPPPPGEAPPEYDQEQPF